MLSKRSTFRVLALPLLAAVLCGPSQAAELGEVKVNSHIGQQLSADIELVDLTPADLADLQAKLANPDVFKGANLSMPPVLNGLYISVARRDNRRFLHLTTLQPVNAEALHLFLELNSGGRQIIRAASLWLTPEPPPQRIARSMAMPAAAPVAASPPAPTTVPAPAQPAVPVAAAATPPASGEAALSEAAQRAFEHRKRVALAQAQAQSTAPAQVAAPASTPVAAVSAAPAMQAKPATSGGETIARQVAEPPAKAPPKKSPPKPVASPAAPVPAPAPEAAPQSCAPAQQVEAQLAQCQAMTSKLVDIEGKVQRLQVALGVPAAAAPAGMPASANPPGAPKADAAPVVPPSKPGAVPLKPGVAADLADNSRTRLIMVGAGALAGLVALGGLFYFLRKRKVQGPLKIWQSFRKKGNAEAKEPTLDEPAEAATQA